MVFKKPYIHVDDLIKILFKVYKNKTREKINIFNIGPDDSGITVRQIVNKLSKLKIFAGKSLYMKKKSTGWVGDISKYSYNVNKIKKLIKLKKLNSSNTAINTTIKQIKILRNDNNKESIESKFYRRGTDFEKFYSFNKGGVISTSIEKYVYVTIKEKFDKGIKLSYSRNENISNTSKIKHKLIKNIFSRYKINSILN